MLSGVVQTLTRDSLSWLCPGDEGDCGAFHTASPDSAVWCAMTPGKQRGPTIALPRCACGTQTFLKADYTLKELWQYTQTVVKEQGVIWAYALPLAHVRTLRLHLLLYEQGRAAYAPLLPAPPAALLASPQMQALGDMDVAHSLWWGFQTVRQYTRLLTQGGKNQALLGETTER